MRQTINASIIQVGIVRIFVAGLILLLPCALDAGDLPEGSVFEFRTEPGLGDLFAMAEYRTGQFTGRRLQAEQCPVWIAQYRRASG